MAKVLETEIHQILETKISSNQLCFELEEETLVKDATASLYSADFIPSFSIDYLARKKLLLSAKYVLGKLNGLDIISSDKSISMQKSEILRPDIVSYNKEENCFVVFEVKKDKHTAREALSELLAYEQEIQNHMPFSSSLDILFVIVSPEWSPLLEHAVTSAVSWSNRKILALHYDTINQKFSVFIPSAWTRLSIPHVSKNAGATLTLYCDELRHKTSDSVPREMINTLDLIRDYGNREMLSGFCYLWRDWHPLSPSKWNITICVINPTAILQSIDFSCFNKRKTDLANYIEENIDCSESWLPSSMFAMANKGKDYLNNFSNPSYADARSIDIEFTANRSRSMPVEFRFFGELSDFTSELMSTEAFWIMNNESLDRSKHNFSSPWMAMPFISDVFGNSYLKDGLVNLYECAKIGKCISTMEFSLKNYIRNENEPEEKRKYFLCIYRWSQFEFITIIRELKFLLRSVKNELKSLPVSKLSDNESGLDSLSKFRDWFIDELLEEAPIHQDVFKISCHIGFLNEPTYEDIVSENDALNLIASSSDYYKNLVPELIRLNDDEINSKGNLETLRKLSHICGLIDSKKAKKSEAIHFVRLAMKEVPIFMDNLFQPIHFQLSEIDLSRLDWVEIRNSYLEHVNSGFDDICVCLKPNGEIGIAHHQLAPMLSSNVDHDDAFLFLDERHGSSMIIKVSWDDVYNGKFFEELR